MFLATTFAVMHNFGTFGQAIIIAIQKLLFALPPINDRLNFEHGRGTNDRFCTLYIFDVWQHLSKLCCRCISKLHQQCTFFKTLSNDSWLIMLGELFGYTRYTLDKFIFEQFIGLYL